MVSISILLIANRREKEREKRNECGGLITGTDYGHPERAFFFKSQAFGLGQTNWGEHF